MVLMQRSGSIDYGAAAPVTRCASLPSLQGNPSWRSMSFSRTKGKAPVDVPKGSLAVYVGDEERRFVIPISYLKHPFVLALLKESEEEFGFCHNGAMHLPCTVPVFLNVLRRIESQALPTKMKIPRGPMGLIVL